MTMAYELYILDLYISVCSSKSCFDLYSFVCVLLIPKSASAGKGIRSV